jgi:hypothetical protein
MKNQNLLSLLLTFSLITPTIGLANHDLWLAVKNHNWNEARQLIKDGADPDYIPYEGPNRLPNQGASVLWWVQAFAQWDLAQYILEIKPNANCANAPTEGSFRGDSVIWLVAAADQKDLFTLMLKNNPQTDLDAVTPGRENRGGSLRRIISFWKDYTLK